MNIKVLIATILSIVLWVALVVSLATPWFWLKEYDGSDDDYTINYYKYNEIKSVEYEDGSKYRTSTQTFTPALKRAYKNQISIFSASLAFTVLALVVVTIFIACLFLQLVSKCPIGAIAKFIPIISLIFCLLAMFIFCGVTNARKKDCERTAGAEYCEAEIYNSFLGSEGDIEWGGSVGFVFIIISSGLNLATALVVILLGVFNSDDAPAAQ